MLKAVEIKPDVFWVGGIDWNERNFHGYTTERGSTYNAYLIMDEKITLIDTCKRSIVDELIERIGTIVDPAKIAYIVSNHVEMDHSGGLPALAEIAPNATIVTGAPKGVAGLTAHYGEGLNLMGVKTGDTLNIGKRTLTFVQTPMVHWPDSMVTYDEYDIVLEGALEIEIDGRIVSGGPGDIIYIPKGSHIHFQTPSYAKYVYTVYPANWQEG